MPNLEIKTEGQVLKDKIALLNSTSNSDVPSLIIVLEELEDLAHKVSRFKLMFLFTQLRPKFYLWNRRF